MNRLSKTFAEDRWLTALLPVGSCIWMGWIALHVPNFLQPAWAESILLLAILVILPLVLRLLMFSWTGWSKPAAVWIRVAGWLHPPTALLVLLAFTQPQGLNAALCCVPWFVFACLLAVASLHQAVKVRGQAAQYQSSYQRSHECSYACLFHWPLLAACCYLPIGAAWLILSRAGIRPLGFSDAIVLLTAIHFHFAGLIAPLIAGFVLKMNPSRSSKLAAWGICLGVPLVAVGITATQLGASPIWEHLTAGWLSAAGLLLANEQFRLAQDPASGPSLARWLWRISSAALALGMVLSLAYRIQFIAGQDSLTIPWMRATHGTLNALGFALCGLLGWWWKFQTESCTTRSAT